ncbi:MAG TPA: hypothetical protein VF828_04200 [Patescibacteria group bacterium]
MSAERLRGLCCQNCRHVTLDYCDLIIDSGLGINNLFSTPRSRISLMVYVCNFQPVNHRQELFCGQPEGPRPLEVVAPLDWCFDCEQV